MNRAKLLQTYLDKQGVFDWNGNNCAHFAGGWVKAVEGSDPLLRLPAMSSKASAYRVIVEAGGWEEAVTQALGRAPVDSVWLQTGDLVLLDVDPGVKALAIVNGRYASGISEAGVVSKLIAPQSIGWKVGRD